MLDKGYMMLERHLAEVASEGFMLAGGHAP